MAVAEVNEAVLQAVEEHALTPQAIEQVVHMSERADMADQQAKFARHYNRAVDPWGPGSALDSADDSAYYDRGKVG